MIDRSRRILSASAAALLLGLTKRALAADPEIDGLLKSPVGKDWVTNGGNLTNQRYSTLKQIDTDNVKQLKGAWMTRLKGSGHRRQVLGRGDAAGQGRHHVCRHRQRRRVRARTPRPARSCGSAGPASTRQISTVCCGWLNRGLAMGEGMLFLGQLDANVVALDIKTGKEVWKTPIEDWQNGYGVTSAPLYYDGIVYSGITGGEFGVRGRLTALDAKTGKILWRSYTLPAPGEVGSDTWPAGTDPRDARRRDRSGTRRRSIRSSGWSISRPAIAGRTTTARCARATTCSAPRSWRSNAKTGEYAWHFQQVHHDIWDYDAASPVVLFDTVINGQPRKAIAEAGRTGWVYILDRTNGKPLIGIEEKPVPQEPRQKTAKTQPYPGRRRRPCRNARSRCPATTRPAASIDAFWDTPVLIQPRRPGRHQLVADAVQPGYRLALRAGHDPHQRLRRATATIPGRTGMRYTGGTQAPPIGSPMSGTFTAIDANTNKIAWQQQMPYRMGGGGGSTVTAGGLLLRGEPDGNFVALDAKTGEVLCKFQTGFGADAPPVVYEVDGEQYITHRHRRQLNPGQRQRRRGVDVRAEGQRPAAVAAAAAGDRWPDRSARSPKAWTRSGSATTTSSTAYWPARTRVKPGTTVTFTNVGDLPHTATATAGMEGKWDTGVLAKGESKTITFDEPGIYYYICTPHPWMYGQVIVE